VVNTDEYRVNDEAIAALARQTNVFQRLGQLVYVTTDKSKLAGVVRPEGEPRIAPPALGEATRASGTQRRLAARSHGPGKGWPTNRRTRPPGACRRSSARGEWEAIEPLEGIVEAPMLRPDGSVLTKPGYDPNDKACSTAPAAR
jgi:hypothetical protein